MPIGPRTSPLPRYGKRADMLEPIYPQWWCEAEAMPVACTLVSPQVIGHPIHLTIYFTRLDNIRPDATTE